MNVPEMVRNLAGLKNCPDEQQLAAYAEQQLMAGERSVVETHLVVCDRCLKQVSFLVRSRSLALEAVPKELMKAAAEIGHHDGRKQFGWQWVLAGAASAAMLGALLTMKVARKAPSVRTEPIQVAHAQPAGSLPVTTQDLATREEKVRGADQADQEIITNPKRDQKLYLNQSDFRWKADKDALFYEVQVVTDSGDVVWQQRTDRTEARLAANAKLDKGRTYYVWVRVHKARGTVEQSKAIRFTVQ